MPYVLNSVRYVGNCFLKTAQQIRVLAEPEFGFWHPLPTVYNSSSKESKPLFCHCGHQCGCVHTGKILTHAKYINLKPNKHPKQIEMMKRQGRKWIECKGHEYLL